jgi:proteasome lid subunit RPN8/RPN11
MSAYDYLDFGLGLPVRRRRHLEPMDDHRLIDVRADQRGQPDDEADATRRPKDESPDGDFAPLWAMKITQSAFGEILDYFRSRQPEAAGILLGPAQDDPLVTHFSPDEEGDGTAASFHVNAPGLNRVLKRVKPAGMNGKGIIHSHPGGICQPSAGDLAYMRRLFGLPANAAAQQCFLPIFCDRRVYPYVYARGRLWLAELILV